MKPAIKVKGRTIIIICIIVLIILGVLWLLNNNDGKEGLVEEVKVSPTAAFADTMMSSVANTFNSAGSDINGGKTFEQIRASAPSFFNSLKDIFTKERDSQMYDVSFNSDTTDVIDTTTPACTGKTFLYGKKFGDSLTTKYQGNPTGLNAKCNQLTSESCNLTDSCVWVNGKKCMAGDADGPTIKIDNNGKDIDYAYYTYKSECYGSCGSGANYANPCSAFKDDQPGVGIKCLSRMWAQTGCPNTRYIDKTVADDLADYSKASIKAIFSNAKSEDNYANCYGPNESDWPAPCALYTKADNSKLSVRCLTQLYNDTGCDQTDQIITPEFAANNSFKTKGEWINEFIGYKLGINDDGINDSNFTKCFGPDQVGWPSACSNTEDTTTGLSQRCLTSLFHEAGCRENVSDLITQSYVFDHKYKSKKEMIDEFKNIQSQSDDDSFTKCYGAVKTTWPKRSMILATGVDGKLYFKRSRVQAVGSSGSTLIENEPWILDTTPNQRDMFSITQLTDGSLYGTGTDGFLYTKQKLGDIWVKDPLVPVDPKWVWWSVRQLDDPSKNLIGIGHRNHELFKIDRSPNVTIRVTKAAGWWKKRDTCCVDDILYSDPSYNNPKYPYSVLGAQNHWIWRRKGFEAIKYTWKNWVKGNYPPEEVFQQKQWFSIINIPNGTLLKTDGTPQTKVLAIGTDGKLYVQQSSNIDTSAWSTVENNDIQVKNIAYIEIDPIIVENNGQLIDYGNDDD